MSWIGTVISASEEASLDVDNGSDFSRYNTVYLDNMIQTDTAKWFFTLLKLWRPLERADAPKLAVSFNHDLNDHLTKFELLSGDVSIGHRYFSLVKRWLA